MTMSECRYIHMSECRYIEVSACRFIQISECRYIHWPTIGQPFAQGNIHVSHHVSAAALWLKLQSAVAELRRHQLAAIMPGGFDIAMEHICIEPFVDLVDYGRLEATSRFGAYTVAHGTAVAELEEKIGRMRYGLEMGLVHIAGDDPFLHLVDYGRLVATSRFGADTIYRSARQWC